MIPALVTYPAAHTRPVAAVRPAAQTCATGMTSVFSAYLTTVPEGEDISWTASLVSAPGGSEARVRSLNGDGSLFGITPDLPGEYRISVTASTEWKTSEAYLVSTIAVTSLSAIRARDVIDASFFFRVLSDVWDRIEGRELLGVYWSGLLQVVGEDLIRLYQARLGLSPMTIQDREQRRWMGVHPRMSLSNATMSYGNNRSGTQAFTRAAPLILDIYIINRSEFIVPVGYVASVLAARSIYVQEGANIGNYEIRGRGPGSNSVLLIRGSNFRSPSELTDPIATGRTIAGSATLTITTGTVPLTGDLVFVLDGPDAGYHSVVSVDGSDIVLSTSFHTTQSGVRLRATHPVRATLPQSESTTKTICIPQEEASFAELQARTYTGEATCLSNSTISVARRHWSPGLVGKTLLLRSPLSSGVRVQVLSLGSTPGVCVISSRILDPVGTVLRYEVTDALSLQRRLIGLNGAAYSIRSIRLNEEEPPVESGGRGPHWEVSVLEDVPAGIEAGSWVVGGTVHTKEDLRDTGVVSGDVLILRITHPLSGRFVDVLARVYGAARRAIGFTLGLEGDALTPETWYSLATTFGVGGASLVDGELVVSGEAEAIQESLQSVGFLTRYGGAEISKTTPIELPKLRAHVEVRGVIRNTSYPVHADVRSIPMLVEHISGQVGTDWESVDGQEHTRDSASLELREGVEYVVEGGWVRFVSPRTTGVPLPEELWAPSSYYDSGARVESDFGLAVGVRRSQALASGISYVTMVRSLLYAWMSPPTPHTVKVASQAVLGLPILTEPAVLVRKNDDYSETMGEAVFEDTDINGYGRGVYRTIFYPNSAAGTLTGREGLAVNPATNVPYAVGDSVKPFTPLTRAVEVYDYVSSPGTVERIYGESHPIQTFHTWVVSVDGASADPNGLGLLAEALDNVRPIQTRVVYVLERHLLDVLIAESSLRASMELTFVDSPAFGSEGAYSTDSTNDSGVALRRYESGAFQTRVFLHGLDLEILPGGSVRSLAGGFLDAESVEAYGSTVTVAGTNMVREGDILILIGDVSGAYTIMSVISDTEMEIVDHPDPPFESVPVSELPVRTGVQFSILRQVSDVLYSGEVELVEGSISVTTSYPLWSDGVAVGDWVCSDEASYRIVAVNGTELTVTPAPEVSGSTFVRIIRDGLADEVVCEYQGSAESGTNYVVLSSQIQHQARLRPGDILRCVEGDFSGMEFTPALLHGDRVYVRSDFTSTGTGLFQLVRPSFSGGPSADTRLSECWPEEESWVELYNPQRAQSPCVVSIGVDGSVTADFDMEALPVPEGSILQVAEYSGGGVFVLSNISGSTATAAPTPREEIVDGDAEITTDTEGFYVLAADVESALGFDFEAEGIRVGDVFSFEGGSYGIIKVAGTTLTLAEDTGVTGSPLITAGRVMRAV